MSGGPGDDGMAAFAPAFDVFEEMGSKVVVEGYFLFDCFCVAANILFGELSVIEM